MFCKAFVTNWLWTSSDISVIICSRVISSIELVFAFLVSKNGRILLLGVALFSWRTVGTLWAGTGWIGTVWGGTTLWLIDCLFWIKCCKDLSNKSLLLVNRDETLCWEPSSDISFRIAGDLYVINGDDELAPDVVAAPFSITVEAEKNSSILFLVSVLVTGLSPYWSLLNSKANSLFKLFLS